jgi:hypothetical protein
MRSMVEGASDATPRCHHKQITASKLQAKLNAGIKPQRMSSVAVEAPSTALLRRAVPLPHFVGAEENAKRRLRGSVDFLTGQ